MKYLWFISLGFLFISQHPVNPQSLSGPCRKGWVSLYGSCYMFSRFKSTWAEAEVTCKAFHSNLVEVDDLTEHLVLVGHLQTLHPHDADKRSTSYWTGGNDIESERHFVWAGSGQDVTYTHWYRGQPDVASAKQDCILLYGPDNFAWHDISCETQEQFICETG